MSVAFVSRRGFLQKLTTAATIGCAAPLLARPLWAASISEKQVRTRTGVLRGTTDGRINCFKGVPFAQPPVGKLRFRAPERLAESSSALDATHFAPAAMQWPYPGAHLQEDCLYLNIWAPESKGPHPVYFWIHGGGFLGGRSSEPIFDGSGFAREDVVVVTVGYRLGIFGFLDLEPLLGAEYAGSANHGLLDLVTALEWVHENIAGFGGDPDRVTIGGQSAGAKLAALLMATPRARGLFSGAISESGGADRAFPRKTSLEVAKGFGECFRAENKQPIESLRTLAASELIQLQGKFIDRWPVHFPLRASVEGHVLPAWPLHLIEEHAEGRRLLIGTNRDESAAFIGPHPEHDPQAADLGNMALGEFTEVMRHYAEVYPTMSPEQRRIRATTAEEYWVPSLRVAEAACRGGSAVWMYRLDAAPNSGHLSGQAAHSAELDMVWQHPYASGPTALYEKILTAPMHEAWLNFIHHREPASRALPPWPRFNEAERATMLFDLKSRVEGRPQEKERLLWEGTLIRPYAPGA